MVDATTFFARISSFFLALWAYVLRVLSMRHRSTNLCDDLEVGIPSGKRQVSGNFNTALPVVSGSDGFVDIRLNPDSKTTEKEVVSIATHSVPTKPSVIKTDHFQPTVKIDKSVPVLFSAIPVIPQIDIVDNRSKHKVVQFGPYSLREDHLKSRPRRCQDSFSDLLDLFPVPPTYIPVLHPIINGDVIPQTVEKTPLAPAENCPSPPISEEELVSSSSSVSTSISSTDPSLSISISISISNETADTSVHESLEIPCTSAIFNVLSSEIDVKDVDISRLPPLSEPRIPSPTCNRRSKFLCTLALHHPKSFPKERSSPDLVLLKVEDPANISLSSERAVSRLVMTAVKDELNKVNVSEPRLCDCEWCENSHSWTAEDFDEDDQWSERLNLNE